MGVRAGEIVIDGEGEGGEVVVAGVDDVEDVEEGVVVEEDGGVDMF